ncbi:hypothetical protein EV174_005931 [Coemansia sp. RSA 2320]|nr:hypothetical protein EV174_005931 [Coemansia sp. RSA 2320]
MLQLQIPPATTGVQYECESVDVKISHHLAITALIKSPQGQTVEVMLPAHIYVLPQACIDGSADLPLYELSGSDRLVQSAESSSASAEASPRSSTHSSRTIIESLVGDTPSRSLPPYSLPVCLSCGKEDISVLQCRQAIVSRSQIPLNAEIEDLCVSR